jgi:hypothetical protein
MIKTAYICDFLPEACVELEKYLNEGYEIASALHFEDKNHHRCFAAILTLDENKQH